MKVLKKLTDKDKFWAYLMVMPTFIGLMVLNFIPLFKTLILSFQEEKGFGRTSWVGIENYSRLFSDPELQTATLNTFKYVFYTVPPTIFISLVVAVLLNKKIKGKTIYRTIYFLPVVAAPAAISLVWKWVFNSKFGIINYLLSLLNIQGPAWLSDPKLILISIAVVSVWSAIGFNMILLLSGLQGIPEVYYEAAEIDGASSIKQFFSITIPLLSPTIFFLTVTSVISSIQVFDLVYLMIGTSNPSFDSAKTLIYLFYKNSFNLGMKGYGATIAIFVLGIIMLITSLQLYLQKKWVHYNE